MALDHVHTFTRKDAELQETITLPDCSGGAATAVCTAIDLGAGDAFLADCELHLAAAALTLTEAPAGATMTYSVEHSSDNSAFATLVDELLVQTASTGSAIAASQKRFRIPTDCNRYIRIKASGNATADDCSDSSSTVSLLT